MLTHHQIWRGLDRLAENLGETSSGLAKRAGLDPTTFNPSKRLSADGQKARWPSTESLAKAIEAAGIDFPTFASLSTGQPAGRTVPLLGLVQAGTDGFFDDAGFPNGTGWEDIHFPGVQEDGAYALEITGDSMRPVFRPGDRIIVSPNETPRRGDRIVVRTRSGEVMAKELGRVTASSVELISLNPDFEPRQMDLKEVQWMARIVWASQ